MLKLCLSPVLLRSRGRSRKDGSHTGVAYNEAFKRDAAALVESGISLEQVRRDLGVSNSELSAWLQDARLKTNGMTPSNDPDKQREMRQALKRIRNLEMENDGLRRAATYVSQIHSALPNKRSTRSSKSWPQRVLGVGTGLLSMLQQHGLPGPMRRAGAADDHAMMESFFSLLKKNVLDRRLG